MSITTRTVTRGVELSIQTIVEGDRSPFERFFAELSDESKGRLRALLESIANKGAPRNVTKFRHEEDGIFAIKQDQIRVYCFFDSGRLIVVTHGVLKKRQKANPEDLKRAKRLREEYLKSKRS